MNRLTFHKTFFLFLLSFPLISFSQSTNDYFLSGKKIQPHLSQHLLQNEQSIGSSSLSNDNALLSAKKGDSWDMFSSTWSPLDSTEYFYQNGLEIESITKVLENGIWVNSSRILSEYNTNGLLSLQIDQNWENNDWVNVAKLTHEYDGNNATLWLYQDWENNGWVNSYQIIYVFNADNKVTSSTRQDWENSNWVNINQTNLEYNNSGLLGVYTLKNWDGSGWLNSNQESYEYNNKDLVTHTLSKIWDGSSWINQMQRFDEYNENDRPSKWLWQDWTGSSWVDGRQYLFEYGTDRSETWLYQIWAGSTWFNSFQFIYQYDESGNRISDLFQLWINESWANSTRNFYYYEVTSSNINLTSLDFSVHTFPNPNTGSFTIELGESLLQTGTLNIFNTLGQLVDTQNILKGDNKKSIQLPNVLEGTYFLQLVVGNQQSTQTLHINN